MAYTLAKIVIKELKKDAPAGLNTFGLVGGLIPTSVDGLSQVADSTEPLVGEWSYFPTEKQLKFNLNALVPNQYVDYSLLCSNKNGASYPLDPEGVGTKYIWPPYFDKAPDVKESSKNLLEGIISFSNMTLRLQSGTNDPLRNYFGSNFSVKGYDFRIWNIDNDGVISQIYIGMGENLEFDSTSVIYSAIQKLKNLDNPADWGCPLYEVKEETPVICAGIIPWSIDFAENDFNTRDGNRAAQRHESWRTFKDDTLPKIQGDFSNATYLEINLGISFGAYSDTDFERSADFTFTGGQVRYFANDPAGNTAKEGEYIYNYIAPLSIESYEANTPTPLDFTDDSTYDKIRHPLDNYRFQWFGSFRPAYNVIVGNYYAQFGLNANDGSTLTFYYGDHDPAYATYDTFLNLDPVQTLPRYKILYRPTDKYNDFRDKSKEYSGANNTCTSKLRSINSSLVFDDDTVEFPGVGNARTLVRQINYSDLGKLCYDLTNRPAGLDNCFEFYYQHHMVEGSASLSMQNFLDATIRGAGFTPDLTELDFDEDMQIVETYGQSYRKYLERILPSIGYFLRLDQSTGVAKLIKIDDTKPVVDTLTENDFSNLRIKLNTNDTYSKVIFKNKSMLLGTNTTPDYPGKNYYVEVNAENDLNSTNKEKEIELLTMESPRTAFVARLNTDNKFDCTFKAPSTKKNILVGDWIYLETDQLPEPSNQAKILITQRTVGETSISFGGIKFASIN